MPVQIRSVNLASNEENSLHQGTEQTDADPEPQLAASERVHRGAGLGAAVERVRSRRGPGRLPDLHVGGLGEAAARGRRAVHPGGPVPPARAGGDHVDRLRPAACGGRDVQPAEHLQA